MNFSLHHRALLASLFFFVSALNAAPPLPGTDGPGNSDATPGYLVKVTDLPALEKAKNVIDVRSGEFFARPGVQAAGISWAADGSPVIKLFLDTDASAAGIPAAVDGIPVITEFSGKFFALNVSCEDRGRDDCDVIRAEAAAAQPPNQRDWHPRPVPIGVSAGHVDITAGTLGCRVTRGCHNYALSNAHVFAAENAGVVGDHVLQPAPNDGGIDPDDVIATLYESVPIVMGTSGSVKNRVDAAIAATDASLVGTTTRTNGYGTPRSQTVNPQVGMTVQKYGRSSSQTSGYIDAINTTVLVGYKEGTARFVEQTIIKSVDEAIKFSRAGDSGSLIVVEDGADDRKPVGLLFASSSDNVLTIANPINFVLAELDIEIDGE
jgi:hypothetical protein